MAVESTARTHVQTSGGASEELAPVVEAWNEFFASIRRARGRAARQHGNELTLSQYGILKALAEADSGLRIGELAEAASIAAPTASRMIDTLEKEGIVARHRSRADRRAIAITLTGRGTEMFECKSAVIEGKRDDMFRSLSPTEREHAERLLRRMADLMEDL
jgi:MarR family transcriptional regulator, organic hydroperoxide resistance regulator